jgi:hypothetical protein
LQLTEHSACPEKGESDSDGCCKRTFPRLRRLLCNVLHDFQRAFIEKITHLLCEFAPGSSRIVAEDHTDDCEQNENERREGKNRVIRQRRTELRRFILQPLLEC